MITKKDVYEIKDQLNKIEELISNQKYEYNTALSIGESIDTINMTLSKMLKNMPEGKSTLSEFGANCRFNIEDI